MRNPTHVKDARFAGIPAAMKKHLGKKWWGGWKHYKTKRGAQAYAKKHEGVWIIIDSSPEIMTPREVEWMGTWVVGRADAYLFYQGQLGDKFEEYYRAVEFWKDGGLYVSKGDEITKKEISLIEEELINAENQLSEIVAKLDSAAKGNKSLKNEYEQMLDKFIVICGKLIIAELNNKSINN